MPFRVVFHGMLLHPQRRGGAETYCRRLLAALEQLDQENEYFVIVPHDSGMRFSAPNFQLVECSIPALSPYRRVLWEQSVLPSVIRKLRPDVVHFPASTAPFSFIGPAIVTIHETLRFQLPGVGSRLLSWYYSLNQKWIVKTRKKIIAVSRSDAEVMAANLGVPSEEIAVTYLAFDEAFQRPNQWLHGDPRYLLYLGRAYEHKNLELLLQAMVYLRSVRTDVPKLRIVGLSESEKFLWRKRVEQLQLTASCEVEESVPLSKVPELLHGAGIFCFPSRFESFGLPVLEALAAGTPVVCSDLPPFRELFGDAVLRAPANNAEQFAQNIALLLDDQLLRERQIERGLACVAQFSWERCARETLAVYRDMAAKT